MMDFSPVDGVLERLYREEWGTIVATLIRQLGDFELAEDSAQEAFTAAVAHWRHYGLPNSPRAWLIGTARHKAIDVIRRRERLREILVDTAPMDDPVTDSDIADDRLRLLCTCCHPALSVEAQVALTLRTLGGLTTEEIARAFLVPEPTMAQRLVRAKRKIKDAGIPYIVPDAVDMPQRLDGILTTIYLIFNEGYASTGGPTLLRADLCAEAIRLARIVCGLMRPTPSEATALLALMLLHDSRRAARFTADGGLVVLGDQDRGLWDREQIAEAIPLVEAALSTGTGPYAVQAAIAAVHCQSVRADDTDWTQILQLYGLLEQINPSPVVSLNRAVAMSMAVGPAPALEVVNGLADAGVLNGFHLLEATRADLLRRLGRYADAATSYEAALDLATNESERRFLESRREEMLALAG